MVMTVVTFLKKDELAFRIYKAIWKNRNIRIVPKNPHFFMLAPGEINHFGPIENRQLQTNKKSHCHNS